MRIAVSTVFFYGDGFPLRAGALQREGTPSIRRRTQRKGAGFLQ